MIKPKKIPMRTCIACREMKPKAELMRIVCNKQGEIFFDPTSKQNGRGAYICKSRQCIEKARKTSALSRAFETAIAPEVYDKLSAEVES